MPTHGQVAAAARLNKELHPDEYCPNMRCLWRTGGEPCPNHRPALVLKSVREATLNVMEKQGRPYEGD